jgi:hypothetical protein
MGHSDGRPYASSVSEPRLTLRGLDERIGPDPLAAAAAGGDSRAFAGLTFDGRVWARTETVRHRLEWARPAAAVAVSAASDCIAAVDGDGHVRRWVVDDPTWTIADTIVPTATGACAIAVARPNGSLLALGTVDGRVIVQAAPSRDSTR